MAMTKLIYTVKLDVDGVIRDIVTPMCYIFNEQFNMSIKPEDIDEYDVEEFFGKYHKLDPQKDGASTYSEYFFKEWAGVVFYNWAKCYKGVKEAIDKLHDTGLFRIIIVTKQYGTINKKRCLDFLDRENIYYDDICFVDEKTLINGDVIIDDNPEFLNMEDLTITRICIDKPYNREKCFCDYRVKDLSEAVDILIKELAYD